MGTSQFWGTVGTWVIGAFAFLIAALQYLNSLFRPRVVATFGPVGRGQERRRFVVTIRNKGGAPGMVARVGIMQDPDHKILAKVTYPGWPDKRPPFPFLLPGHSAAIVILDMAQELRPAARVIVAYDGTRETCMKFRVTDRVLVRNRTALPPDSLALLEPPETAGFDQTRRRLPKSQTSIAGQSSIQTLAGAGRRPRTPPRRRQSHRP